MADTSQSEAEPPITNGVSTEDEDERHKQRPADIDAVSEFYPYVRSRFCDSANRSTVTGRARNGATEESGDDHVVEAVHGGIGENSRRSTSGRRRRRYPPADIRHDGRARVSRARRYFQGYHLSLVEYVLWNLYISSFYSFGL